VNETFDWRRLRLLMRNDIVAEYRSFLIVWGVLAAIMLIGSASRAVHGSVSAAFYQPWYLGMVFIWGTIVASRSFREMYDKTKNEAYLLLPASVHEKLAARLLRLVAFFICLLVFLTVTSVVIEGVNQVAFGRHNGVFNPFDGAVWSVDGHPVSLYGNFVVLASLFFLGAAWFRKRPFIKTALVLTLLPNVLAVLAIGLLAILFHGHYDVQIDQFQLDAYYAAHELLARALLAALKVLYFFVLPLFCWTVAWLRLREVQVSDGI
jgi:hypothetical protein